MPRTSNYVQPKKSPVSKLEWEFPIACQKAIHLFKKRETTMRVWRHPSPPEISRQSCASRWPSKLSLDRRLMPVANLLKLGRGAVIPLDPRVGEPVDIIVNGRIIARGEIVVVEDDNSRLPAPPAGAA